MPSIELTQPRVIAIDDHGKKYQLTVARITQKQWQRYFDAIQSTSENQGGKRVDSFDSTSGRLALVESALIDAKGYTSREPITSISEWQKKLPLSHRAGVGSALTDVSRSEAEGDAITLGRETIYLDAVWSADSNGIMRKFRGLRHSFQTPTAEQQHRYSRDASRSVLVGGARNGKTRWLGPQSTLLALYDELVLEVDGYTVNGEVLDRDGAIANMDGYHKVAAAAELFSPAAPDVSEVE